MGKKQLPEGQQKRVKKDVQQPITRRIKINLHKQCHGIQFKKKAPRAIKAIKSLVQKTMFTKDVRIDPELNKDLWKNGIRNIPNRVEIIMERKKNEDEEEGQEKMYTLVKLAPMFDQTA